MSNITPPPVEPKSTQQQFPWRAAIRTAIAVIITWIPLLAVAVSYFASDPARPHLPHNWELWISIAATWLTVVSAYITRIMANPIVDQWLERIGISSTPKK